MSHLNVIERGSARPSREVPLLFVHGACLGAWCWEEHFLPDFARRGYRCAAVDLRGHGGSDGRADLGRATLDDYVADVLAVASRFDVPPVVVGHSMGGLVTQQVATRARLSGVVLLASSPVSGMKRHGWALVRAHPWPFLRAILSRQMLRIYADDRLVRDIMFSPNTPEDVVGRCRARLQPESWRACVEMNEPVRPVPAILCPMLVLGGGLDRTVPAQAAVDTGRAYNAETRIFTGAGHNLMLEPCWPEVADCIDEWVRRTALPRPGPNRSPGSLEADRRR